MKMKKVLSLLLAGAMTFSLTACGGSGSTTSTKSSAKSGSAAQTGSTSTKSSANKTTIKNPALKRLWLISQLKPELKPIFP